MSHNPCQLHVHMEQATSNLIGCCNTSTVHTALYNMFVNRITCTVRMSIKVMFIIQQFWKLGFATRTGCLHIFSSNTLCMCVYKFQHTCTLYAFPLYIYYNGYMYINCLSSLCCEKLHVWHRSLWLPNLM